MEKQLSSSGLFLQDFRHCRFFMRSNETKNERTLGLNIIETERMSRTSSCQYSTTLHGEKKEIQKVVEESDYSNKETCANNLSSPPNHSSLVENTVIPTNEKNAETFSKPVPEMVTRLVRPCDQDEREPDGSYHWITVRQVLLKALKKQETQNFSEEYWILFIQEGSSKTRVEYCVDHSNSLTYLRAIQGHPGGFPVMPELMGYTSVP